MTQLLRFLFLLTLWGFSRIFFRIKVRWITPYSAGTWADVRLIAFLHHTSLLEFLFISAVPLGEVWRMAGHVAIPVADTTMKRPLVGFFIARLAPKVISITRKKDASWEQFLDHLDKEDITIIFPEGRMMRATGLDKDGKPMSIRGGIADILLKMNEGKLLLAYSGGLHHVQVPGEYWIRPFKEIEIGFEVISIDEFKKSNQGRSSSNFKMNVIRTIENKMYQHCPMPPRDQIPNRNSPLSLESSDKTE